jgi:alkanesulfonate monooxygenase SsuD/methylene tetrahydromethanopterin reductase-like flavin-dependent oxidoreductase (luciferase family)
VPEVWGYDALTGLAYLAAKTSSIRLGTFVVQLGSRSPALLATSALSLQELSGGRFLLGVGTSGPRVMEGWHGVRFRKPVQTTRETIEVIRIVSRGERLEHAGEIYPLPLPDSSGAALRPLVRPADVPIYIAAADRRAGRRLARQCRHPRSGRRLPRSVAEGCRERRPQTVGSRSRGPQGAADAAARRHADGYAFTIGAMGVDGRNFYNDAFTRLGYGAEVKAVAELWQAGKRDEARRAVPLDLGRLTNLLGTPDALRERVHVYRAAGITTLLAKLEGDAADQLRTLERLLGIVASHT